MDEQDISYCACVDLRNVDVHVDNAVGSARAEFKAQIHDVMPFGDSLGVALKRAQRPDEPGPGPQNIPAAPPNSSGSVTARFFVRPETLPPEFAVPHKKDPKKRAARQTKAAEEMLLKTTPAVNVAQKALDFFEHTVLPGATNRGIVVP